MPAELMCMWRTVVSEEALSPRDRRTQNSAFRHSQGSGLPQQKGLFGYVALRSHGPSQAPGTRPSPSFPACLLP